LSGTQHHLWIELSRLENLQRSVNNKLETEYYSRQCRNPSDLMTIGVCIFKGAPSLHALIHLRLRQRPNG
ncbi:hypothetical protein KUCAC02_022217, partial [Chaenocephalus aceratus]